MLAITMEYIAKSVIRQARLSLCKIVGSTSTVWDTLLNVTLCIKYSNMPVLFHRVALCDTTILVQTLKQTIEYSILEYICIF